MTRKITVVHKLARLIPTIRKLHDSALEANAQLDEYVQENERLRNFMENEADKYSQLHIQQADLRKEVLGFQTTKNELLQVSQEKATLEQKVKSLEIKISRNADLQRLQEDLSAEFAVAQDELYAQVNKSHALKKKLRKKKKKHNSELESLEQVIAQLKNYNEDRSSRLRELEKTLSDRTSQTEQMIHEKHELIERLIHLETIIEESRSKSEQDSQNLQAAEARLHEQLNRSIELESMLQNKNVEIQELNADAETFEKRLQEQLSRLVELESMLNEKNSEIQSLNQRVEITETSHKEQIERSLFLEREIQNHVDANNILTQQYQKYSEKMAKLEELQNDIDHLAKELNAKDEQLKNTEHLLNDSQHYATVRSEEALARILGKLSQIDHKTSLTPLANGTVPLTNYSTQEVILGKYFDLLIGTLTGTLIEDEPISPWSEGKYDPEVRSLGRDWPATACSMIGTVRMTSLQRLVCDVIENDVPGDAIETGVWRGGACILMKSIFNIYGCTDRKVWVADSFQGLPKPDASKFEADADDVHHTFEPLSVSKEQVADNFRKFGVLDNNVKFIEGFFKDTLHKTPIEKLAILRMDGDMEESTSQALDALYHKVSKGGYVIIDDYGLGPCRKAVDNFRDKHGIKSPIFEVDAACVYWQVE